MNQLFLNIIFACITLKCVCEAVDGDVVSTTMQLSFKISYVTMQRYPIDGNNDYALATSEIKIN